MASLRHILIASALALAGCASVSTSIVELKPAEKYPPTQNVEVLLAKPGRPYTEIALLESRGEPGVPEADLLNDAREKARALGADAIVKLETERSYREPMALYDPWFEPYAFGWYRYRPFPRYRDPWGPYQVVGGGYSYQLRSMAIKYR
jgi:hypothetical protein